MPASFLLPVVVVLVALCAGLAARLFASAARFRTLGETQALAQEKAAMAREEALVSALPHLAWTARQDGTVEWFNKQWTDYTGLAHRDGEDEARRRLVVHPDDQSSAKGLWRDAVASGRPFEAEYRLRRADGIYRWHLMRATPLRDGDRTRWLGTCTDIHDQKLAEQQARLARQQLLTVVNNSPVVLWATDAAGRVEVVEGKGLADLGRSPGQGVGASIFDFLGDDQEALAHVRRALAGEAVSAVAAFRGRWHEAYFSPLLSDDGAVNGMVGIAFDVTHRREAQRLAVSEGSAREALRLKSEFLANMSHEIRTPINGVLGMAGFLLETTLGREQRDFAESIVRSGEALLTVVDDVLDFSRLEAGSLGLEAADFELAEVLRATEATFAGPARQAGVALELARLDGPAAKLHGDAAKLGQVLASLVGNAVKFSLPGGRVTVRVQPTLAPEARVTLRFEVDDEGIGIAREAQDRLFTPFSQADASTSRRYGGTGLGLSLAKRLVELMGGTIGFASEEGRGSRFWFTVALALAADAAAGVQAPTLVAAVADGNVDANVDANGSAPRVLVVEDNVINQRIAVRMLESLGCTVDVATNGVQALATLAAATFDVVFMDCQMPEMDGYEATQRIRAGEAGVDRTVPIVAMTAHALPGDREKCLAHGMDDYVAKPVKKALVAAALERWLTARRGPRSRSA